MGNLDFHPHVAVTGHAPTSPVAQYQRRPAKTEDLNKTQNFRTLNVWDSIRKTSLIIQRTRKILNGKDNHETSAPLEHKDISLSGKECNIVIINVFP